MSVKLAKHKLNETTLCFLNLEEKYLAVVHSKSYEV